MEQYVQILSITMDIKLGFGLHDVHISDCNAHSRQSPVHGLHVLLLWMAKKPAAHLHDLPPILVSLFYSGEQEGVPGLL